MTLIITRAVARLNAFEKINSKFVSLDKVFVEKVDVELSGVNEPYCIIPIGPISRLSDAKNRIIR